MYCFFRTFARKHVWFFTVVLKLRCMKYRNSPGYCQTLLPMIQRREFNLSSSDLHSLKNVSTNILPLLFALYCSTYHRTLKCTNDNTSRAQSVSKYLKHSAARSCNWDFSVGSAVQHSQQNVASKIHSNEFALCCSSTSPFNATTTAASSIVTFNSSREKSVYTYFDGSSSILFAHLPDQIINSTTNGSTKLVD